MGDWDPELENEISSGQGWDETKISSDQGWDETQVKRSETWPVPPWEDDRYKDCFTDGMLDPTKCPYKRSSGQGWDETQIRFRGSILDQHKPNPLEPEVEPNLQFPDGPAKRFLKFPPGHHGEGDWNGPQVEPPTDPSLERFSKFPGKFPPGHHGEGDWNGPQVEPPTDPSLDLFVKPDPNEPQVEPNLQFPDGPARR